MWWGTKDNKKKMYHCSNVYELYVLNLNYL